jgi:hypothetical protein
MGAGGHSHVRGLYPLGRVSVTHCTGGCVDIRAILDWCGERRFPPVFDTQLS